MYIDDIKRFAKNEKESETLIKTLRKYSQDIGMEFGIEECTMMVMKSCKRHTTERVELPNKVVIRTLGEKETQKYLKILEADTMKQAEMREKNFKMVSQDPENFSKQNSVAGILSKRLLPGSAKRQNPENKSGKKNNSMKVLSV